MTYNAIILKSKVVHCPMVTKMSRCFCVRLDDEVELILDVDTAGYHLLKDEQLNDNCRTPLHWAAAMGQTQAVTSLLELNANPNPVDLEQGTPLDYARQSGHEECVQILEGRLGLRDTNGSVGTPGGQGLNHNAGGNGPPPKGKKGPLGFIVDLFKLKKPKANTSEFSAESQNTYNETSGSSGDSYNNNRGGGSNNNGDRMNTPKKLREPEMLISMEKLQVSREDNPVMTSRGSGGGGDGSGGGSTNSSNKQKDAGYELGEIHPSHSQNVPLGAAAKSVLPSRVSNESKLDHSHLIRSPPPNLKRGNSPIGAGTWSLEKDHGKLEEDAATILALQRTVNFTTPGNCGPISASKSLSPISKGGEPCLYARRPQTTQTKTPSGGTGHTSISPGGESITSSVSSSRSHPAQLAPLKGPMPPPSPRLSSTTNTGGQKRLDGLERQPSHPSRTPTPPQPTPSSSVPPLTNPRRDSLPPNRSADNKHEGPETNPQRKKKKKKKAINSELRENLKLGDPYLDAAENSSNRRTFNNSFMEAPSLRAPPLGQKLKH